MAVFHYQGLNAAGVTNGGLITADTPSQARELLRQQEIYPTAIAPAQTRRSLWQLLIQRTGSRIRDKDLVSMTRQLAVLLRSGIPLAGAFDILSRQQQRRSNLQQLLLDLAESIKGGASFAGALRERGGCFDSFYVSMVEAGEESGHLPDMLFRLARYLKNRYQLRTKTTAALTYPAFMAVVGVAVVTFLMAGVVPKITQVLLSQGAGLPMSTQLLLTLSDGFQRGWPFLLCGFLALYLCSLRLLRLPQFRFWWDRSLLKLPVIGEICGKAALSRFSSTLSTLLRSGIPAVEALRLTSGAIGNAAFGRSLSSAADNVTQGVSLATALQCKEMPLAVTQMVDVGERSGELPEILENLGADFDADLETAIGQITALLEPVIILIMAIIVGFIALSIIQPIMEMSNILK
ncbi:MAG: type II secretion system F family protein [Planctomycetota bacterium]|jgi:general secretion pathway protein F